MEENLEIAKALERHKVFRWRLLANALPGWEFSYSFIQGMPFHSHALRLDSLPGDSWDEWIKSCFDPPCNDVLEMDLWVLIFNVFLFVRKKIKNEKFEIFDLVCIHVFFIF